jgi:two-component system LytT family sensor kinase
VERELGIPRLRWIFAAWFVVGALSTSQSALQRSLSGLPMRSNFLAIWSISLAIWALLTPLMWRMSNVVRLEDGVPRFVTVHLSAAFVFTLGEAALDSFFLLDYLGLPRRSWTRMVLDMSLINTVSYGAVIAAEHIDRYQKRSAAEAARAAQLESDLRQARIEVLEAQLRPHFLFNALNTISSLVRARQDQAAIGAVAALGDVLRGSLRQTAPEVTLREELKLAERYLDLERARFGDALKFSVEADAGTDTAQVPSLLLQPLVENALKHGRGHDGGADVQIRALREGDQLRIEVSDHGSGPVEGASDGIGLSNTRARLKQLYGERGRLYLRRAGNGGGAIAEVVLPLRGAAALG